MTLAELRIEDLRCIETAELRLGPGINLIYGANGAGKTSVLEACFLLGRGRSFRTRSNERLIRHGQSSCRAVGRTAGEIPHTLGVEARKASDTELGTAARLDGTAVRSYAELATAFPVQVLDPDAHKLIEDGATRRRRWLDWVVFHVEPPFAAAWARYQRALLQRNAALKRGLNSLDTWDHELAKEGEVLSASRQRTLAALQPYWSTLTRELLGVDVTLGYLAGWDQSAPLVDELAASLSRDRERGVTHVGPHRADVSLRIRGKAAREILSRGQQKLAAVALSLSQLEFLKVEHDLRPTLLLDDPSAELDQERLGRFIARVQALQTQILVTALERDYRLFGQPEHVFHVEQGRVTRV
ncbi:MAG: DNA replication/repair protein RecF [Nevskiaceae bacterium]